MGKNSTLDARKSELLRTLDRPMSHIIRVTEGFETVAFRSKFDSWPQTVQVAKPEEGRGRVAALLKRQGLDVKGLMKSAPAKEEELEPHIDCTGHLQHHGGMQEVKESVMTFSMRGFQEARSSGKPGQSSLMRRIVCGQKARMRLTPRKREELLLSQRLYDLQTLYIYK